ncbi:hypothetical protein [Pseudomonas sp. DTU12.3]|uniref:hypothetical protein n=1 Tax=Pseudomonas sp. DTU12.3 TaxID=2073078 RepID=UPI002114F525|nr:hypothetical protein [Pseudomonas sp. DTU12.3]
MPAWPGAVIAVVPVRKLLFLKSREHHRCQQIEQAGDFVNSHRQVYGRFADRLLRQKVFALDVEGRDAVHDLVGENFSECLISRGSGHNLVVDQRPVRATDHCDGGIQIQRGILFAQMLAQQDGGHIAQVGSDTELSDQRFNGFGVADGLWSGA